MSTKNRELTLKKGIYCLSSKELPLRFGKHIPVPEITSQEFGLSLTATDVGPLFITNVGFSPILRLLTDLSNKSLLSLHNLENRIDLSLPPKKQITFFVPHIPEGTFTPALLSITIENKPDEIFINIISN